MQTTEAASSMSSRPGMLKCVYILNLFDVDETCMLQHCLVCFSTALKEAAKAAEKSTPSSSSKAWRSASPWLFAAHHPPWFCECVLDAVETLRRRKQHLYSPPQRPGADHPQWFGECVLDVVERLCRWKPKPNLHSRAAQRPSAHHTPWFWQCLFDVVSVFVHDASVSGTTLKQAKAQCASSSSSTSSDSSSSSSTRVLSSSCLLCFDAVVFAYVVGPWCVKIWQICEGMWLLRCHSQS